MRQLLFILFLWFPVFQQANAQTKLQDGYDVLHAMFEKYEGAWYEQLTFTQKTTFYGREGKVQRVQTWYEALQLPGSLAIKFDAKDSGNGILFRDGMQYGYANGEKIQEVERLHELLVLGFDVYHQHPDTTASQLLSLNYNLDEMYEDIWKGRPVYVVGVAAPDSASPQFWIDKEQLYFVRNITIGRQNTIQEVQFNNYEQLGGGWIAPEVIFKANGFTGLLEEYSEIMIPDSLNSAIFDPENFPEASL